MKQLERTTADLSPDEIVAALRAAMPGWKPAITALSDPEGAKIEVCCVDVYVTLNAAQGVIGVDCWQAHSTGPYKTLAVPTLDEAIKLVAAEFDN